MLGRAYRSLFGQLMLGFLIVGVASFSLNVVLTIAAGRGSLDELVEENLESLARSVLEEVDDVFAHLVGEVRVWSELDVLDEILIDDRAMRIENLLIKLQREHAADYESLSVVDGKGDVVASTRFEEIGEGWPFELPSPRIDVVSLGRIPAITDESGSVFRLSHPVRTRVRPEPIGWLIVEARVGPLRELVARASSEIEQEDGAKFVLLFDDQNRLLAGRPPRLPDSGFPPAVFEATKTPGVATIDLGPLGDYLTATFVRSGPGVGQGSLRAVAFWRGRESRRAGRNFMLAAAGAGMLGLALAIGASFLMARRLTGPLRTITEGTARLAGGDLYHRVPETTATNEVGQLARSFNTMVKRLADAVGSLEASTARWRAIVTHAPDIVMTIARDGTILSINRAAPGYTVEQVTGSKVADYLSGRHAEAFAEALRRVFDDGQASELEIEAVGGEAPPAWYSLRLGPIHQGGQIFATACIATDITEKRHLEREILEVSEEERARIGQDLHDGLGQVLTGTAMLARGLQQKLEDRGLDSESADAKQIAGLINDAIDQTRTLARGLFPVGIGAGGLRAALEELASTVSSMPGVDCQVEGDESDPVLDRVHAMHLFRIVQEAVNNALKHAGASNIRIRVFNEADQRGVAVLDDGVGIATGAELATDGIGLHLMAYRARVIDASLEIRRRPEGGTEVACWL